MPSLISSMFRNVDCAALSTHGSVPTVQFTVCLNSGTTFDLLDFFSVLVNIPSTRTPPV